MLKDLCCYELQFGDLSEGTTVPMVNLSLPAAFEFPLKTQQSSL